MNSVCLVLLLVPAAVLCYNCNGRSDGNYEIGCRSYLICTDGKPVIHDCPRNQTHFMVYDNRTQQCADPSSVMHPCGVLRDCTGIKDGRFPDEDEHCRTFYTCSEGQFLGHNFCPAGLVFDSTKGTCNWKNAVAPPCGDMVNTPPYCVSNFVVYSDPTAVNLVVIHESLLNADEITGLLSERSFIHTLTMVALFVLLSAIFSTGTTYECSPNSNETVEIGCRAFYSCENGHGALIDCTVINSQYVYNAAIGHCDDPLNVAPPCGQQKDCTNLGDRKFADVDNNCTSYYTCYRGTFYGHNTCSPSLVFDESLQSCNWPRNVLPPCGSKGTT
ncbi:uncharacterized protein LOC117332228 [Pecten maximus]|uniref:uncharacterized protein LOC117332228 n=1 Tax=Pecten maximus TaxID=6579 RepID=UPI0014584089|nr:uncharacterized protein LOC117332228 [Pecten maximus]